MLSQPWTRYIGSDTLYVKGPGRDEAYYTTGLALDFYKSYNTSLQLEF